MCSLFGGPQENPMVSSVSIIGVPWWDLPGKHQTHTHKTPTIPEHIPGKPGTNTRNTQKPEKKWWKMDPNIKFESPPLKRQCQAHALSAVRDSSKALGFCERLRNWATNSCPLWEFMVGWLWLWLLLFLPFILFSIIVIINYHILIILIFVCFCSSYSCWSSLSMS